MNDAIFTALFICLYNIYRKKITVCAVLCGITKIKKERARETTLIFDLFCLNELSTFL